MLSPNTSFLHDKKIVLSSHYSSTGFIQHLEEFIVDKKIKSLLTIEHPLHSVPDKSFTDYRFYENGKKLFEDKIKVANRIDIINFIKATLINFWLVAKTFRKWDLYLGSNNLNTFSGIWLRRFGFVKKVVFYTVDFVPNRFSNKILNNVYHWIDKYCVINSDEVWILSPRMREGRRKHLSLDKKYDKKQILVPEGVWIDRIGKSSDKTGSHAAVFIGHLIKRMGVQIVIQAIPFLIKKIPDFKFIIIGKGLYRKELEKLVKQMKLDKYVEFMGYIEDHRDAERLIASCGVGIATYTKEDESGLTFYADPAKTKLYLGAGIPVVMTDTFYNAYDIQDAGGGKVIGENPKEAANAIISIIGNDKTLMRYRQSSLQFAKQFDYPVLLTKHLKRVLK